MSAQPVEPYGRPHPRRPDTVLAVLRALPRHLRHQFADAVAGAPDDEAVKHLVGLWGGIAVFEKNPAVNAAFDQAEAGTLPTVPHEAAR
ncbi:hypothetical protein [Streptomyces sp. ISL-11]|uniref:hypothetical protein n=1 Tax=Streptomyces sp. ISL-11 TaxID=2819174 RepID=UPI001BECF2FA|nr:hypothetical protein [Streptomyces sp. ISL-11]MBT2387672.1 hypothetical protein [Streptomyces sp. ISL-11]